MSALQVKVVARDILRLLTVKIFLKFELFGFSLINYSNNNGHVYPILERYISKRQLIRLKNVVSDKMITCILKYKYLL